MDTSTAAARAVGMWLTALALGGCVAEPEPVAPTPPAPTAPSPIAAPEAPAAPPAAATSSPPAPVATSAATVGIGGGKGPPLAPSRGDDEGDTVIRESGPLSDTQRTVFRAAARCFQRGLDRGEKPAKGSFSIELTIDEAGKVTGVSLAPAYPASVKACLEPKLRAVSFPAQPGGGLRVVRYPMNEVSVGEVEAEP